jgi:hypothetical protein
MKRQNTMKDKKMTWNGKLRAPRLLTGLLATGALVGAYCVATVGVSAVLTTTTDISAQAKGHGGGGHGHGGGGHGHGGGGHWHGGGGHWHGGGGWHGGGRFWHGRWWGPGIGPCWRWTPIGWIWIC